MGNDIPLSQLEKTIAGLEEPAAGATPDRVIDDAVTLYQEISGYKKVLDELQKKLKEIVGDVIMETGQMDWQTSNGRVYVPKPGVSVRYDPKALDILCESDPELKKRLAPHRKETERAGSLTIK